MSNKPNGPSEPYLTRQRSYYFKRKSRNYWLFLIMLGLCGLFFIRYFNPLSRHGSRSFVMKRDYEDSKRIFRISSLPKSFIINKIEHRSGYGMMDGPLPVLYQIQVSSIDYPALVNGIVADRTVMDYKYGRLSAIDFFNRALYDYIFYQRAKSKGEMPPGIDMFDTVTTNSEGYGRSSYIVADFRTTDPVTIYIATQVPYDK